MKSRAKEKKLKNTNAGGNFGSSRAWEKGGREVGIDYSFCFCVSAARFFLFLFDLIDGSSCPSLHLGSRVFSAAIASWIHCCHVFQL